MRGATLRLGDMCDLVAEAVKPGARPDAPYLGLEHLGSGRLERIGGGRASDMRSNTSAFQPGDVLYGRLRPYLDKAVLADTAGVCTTELLVLRARPGVEPRFLASIVHSPSFVEHAVAGTTGVQHPRTSWAHIREFELPALALDQQQQLANLLWLVHEAISQSESVARESQRLERFAMQTLFTRGLRGELQKETEIGPIPESWAIARIGDLFEIEQGLSIKRNLANGIYGTPFLRTSNVYWGTIDLDTVSRMCIDDVPPKKLLNKGDLLVCEGGEIGRAAVWTGEIAKCLYQNHLHRLRPLDLTQVDPRFLMVWLEEGFRHRKIYEGTGNRTTIPNLSRSSLAELSIPHPPLLEQHEAVAILQAIGRKADMHRRKCAALEDMSRALLHKLMTRELLVEQLDVAELDGAVSTSGQVV